MAETVLTNENFENEVIKSDIPVMVDFWATWCGPCKMLAPTVEKISEEYEGKVKVCKADVDNCQLLAAMYGIQSIPTLMFFKNGEVVTSSVGFVPKQKIDEIISNFLL